MRFGTVSALLSASLVTLLFSVSSGCGRSNPVTQKECTGLVDHYFDLKIDEDPDAKKMSAAEKTTFRQTVRTTAASDPDVKQATQDCESQITRTEYNCGMKASTSQQWSDCIE